MRVISSIYHRPPTKKDVNCRRINRERMRHKLALASFIPVPRLVKMVKHTETPAMVKS